MTASITQRMTALGYLPYHTGGGCWTWNQDDSDTYRWLCTDDNALVGDPEAEIWLIGRYRNDSDEPGWINVTGLTLDEAIAHIDGLPIPARGEETVIDGLANLSLLRRTP